MNKRKRKPWITKASIALLAFTILLAPASGLTASAQDTGGFSVRAILPENQVDTRQTYFDLRMNPGDQQTVKIVIDNSRDEELVAQVGLNAASTGRNGIIVYTQPDVRDESLKVAITDVATLGEETVRVPAGGSKEVSIDIRMPQDKLDGVILGGIVVTAEPEDNNQQATEGVRLNNTITYVIGLKLSENDDGVIPDFGLAAITPSLVNYKTAVVTTLHNKAPSIIKNMEVNASVFRSGSETALQEISVENAEMAPLSKGDFVIDWEGQALQPGNYRLRMTAAYEGNTWEWDEEFAITNQANDLNKEAVGLEKNYNWVYLLVGLALLALVGFLLTEWGKGRKKSNIFVNLPRSILNETETKINNLRNCFSDADRTVSAFLPGEINRNQ